MEGADTRYIDRITRAMEQADLSSRDTWWRRGGPLYGQTIIDT